MRNSLIIITLLLSQFCFGQILSFSELTKAKTLSFDQLELFLTNKGFEFYKKTDDYLSKAYHFSYKKDYVTVAYFSVYYDHGQEDITYISLKPQKELFNKLKSEGINLGMKFIKKDDTVDGKGYFTIYKYKNYQVEFWVSEGTANPGLTVYEISVE